MNLHRLTREEARRLAVGAQLLDGRSQRGLVETVEQPTLLQIDPTAAVAPSADLVAWGRLGPTYRPDQLRSALEVDRSLFEFDALIRPMADIGLNLAGMARWPTWERAQPPHAAPPAGEL